VNDRIFAVSASAPVATLKLLKFLVRSTKAYRSTGGRQGYQRACRASPKLKRSTKRLVRTVDAANPNHDSGKLYLGRSKTAVCSCSIKSKIEGRASMQRRRRGNNLPFEPKAARDWKFRRNGGERLYV
jgi:hypothetical protein